MKNKTRWEIAALITYLLAHGWFIWPTHWHYTVEYWESPLEPGNGQTQRERIPVQVRIHRFTGEKENLGGDKGEWGHYVW